MPSTARFLFPEHPAHGRPVFESEAALVPSMPAQAVRSSFRRSQDSASLPPVARVKAGPAGQLSAWTPMVATGDLGGNLLSLAHYKHYDVQLDWCEVRAPLAPACSFTTGTLVHEFVCTGQLQTSPASAP
jgi:hypothetical protein